MHVWLNLPLSWRRAEFVSAAEAHQVLMRASDVFAVDEQARPEAVRLSLSTPGTLADVGSGLETVRALVTQKPSTVT
jgi:DNA-binding transcriptional MocR family regulator